MSLWNGSVDQTVLDEAIDFFGITRPVKIRRSGARRRGMHCFRDGGHLITVSYKLETEDANRVIFHELRHAADCERHGNRWTLKYVLANWFYGYRFNPYELQARGAEALTDFMKIAKPTRRRR